VKTRYAHEAEAPFLAHWPNAEVDVDWHMWRVIAELDDDDEITPDAMKALVEAYGASSISVQAFANAGCPARLRIVVALEPDW